MHSNVPCPSRPSIRNAATTNTSSRSPCQRGTVSTYLRTEPGMPVLLVECMLFSDCGRRHKWRGMKLRTKLPFCSGSPSPGALRASRMCHNSRPSSAPRLLGPSTRSIWFFLRWPRPGCCFDGPHSRDRCFRQEFLEAPTRMNECTSWLVGVGRLPRVRFSAGSGSFKVHQTQLDIVSSTVSDSRLLLLLCQTPIIERWQRQAEAIAVSLNAVRTDDPGTTNRAGLLRRK